jgi:hypothetical protein
MRPNPTNQDPPNTDNRPTVSQKPNLSVIVQDKSFTQQNQPTSPTQYSQVTHQTENITDTQKLISISVIPNDNISPLKRKTPTEEEPLNHKKSKTNEYLAEAQKVETEAATITAHSRRDHCLKSEYSRKKKATVSTKLVTSNLKRHGYSSEAASSNNSLPNSEEGFNEPPPDQ